MKAELKYASMMHGELCVMISGEAPMRMLPALSSALIQVVCNYPSNDTALYISIYTYIKYYIYSMSLLETWQSGSVLDSIWLAQT